MTRKKTIKHLDAQIQKRIEDVTHAFIAEFNPERIILFGSYARGDFSTDSSIDILIIARTTLRIIERIKKAIRISDGDPPVEPLVYTPSEINLLLKQGEGFMDSIIEEGILLYSKE